MPFPSVLPCGIDDIFLLESSRITPCTPRFRPRLTFFRRSGIVLAPIAVERNQQLDRKQITVPDGTHEASCPAAISTQNGSLLQRTRAVFVGMALLAAVPNRLRDSTVPLERAKHYRIHDAGSAEKPQYSLRFQPRTNIVRGNLSWDAASRIYPTVHATANCPKLMTVPSVWNRSRSGFNPKLMGSHDSDRSRRRHSPEGTPPPKGKEAEGAPRR